MPQVTLRDSTHDPLESLYVAYRVAYSKLTPQEVWQRIDAGKITREQMQQFMQERLATGHDSPLEQVWFEFGISGVSRAFSHQYVRTRIGMSPEQQSQRYVEYRTPLPVVIPPSISNRDDAGYLGMEEWAPDYQFDKAMQQSAESYDRLITAGVPAEDARFVLPNATATNLKITINLRALRHVAGLRLCTRAQWEYRKVVALMRGEVVRRFPWLGPYIQVKCHENALGYCDESWDAYQACPLSRARRPPPHKQDVIWLRQHVAELREEHT